MDPIGQDMTLRDYWRILVRRKWLVFLPVVVAMGAALGLSLAQTPIYESSTEVLVQPRTSGSLFETAQGNLAPTGARTIDTEIQVFEGETVRGRVQQNLGLSELPPEATASAVGETDVIRVSARSEDAASAQVLADAYAQAYIEVRREQSVNELLAASAEVQEQITDLQRQIDSLDDDDPRLGGLTAQQTTFEQTLDRLQVDAALRTGGASVLAPAEVATDPVEPEPGRAVLLAGVVGALIGLGAAFLVDHLDTSVRSEEDLERSAPVPVLATVPVDPPPDVRPIALSKPDHHVVESYRGLRTNLQFLGLDRPLKVIQFTSSIAGEGKTTTASNTAVVLAQAGHRVVLVDADLRRPLVHEVFAVASSPGLTEFLLGAPVATVVQQVELGDGTSIDVVASGDARTNPSEVLSSRRTGTLLAELRSTYDFVIVDSAPVLPVADSIALATAVDGVVLVAQAGRATSADVSDSVARLARVNGPLVGMVLNRAAAIDRPGYRYGGYGYGYGVAQRFDGASAHPSTERFAPPPPPPPRSSAPVSETAPSET